MFIWRFLRLHYVFLVKSPIIKIFCTSTYCVILTYFSSLSYLSSISSEDPTPCSRVKCPFYGTCRVKEDGTPYCACPISCLDNYRPVCGSDGKSYLNECFLRSNACFLRKRITVVYSGLCSKLVCLLSISFIVDLEFNPFIISNKHNFFWRMKWPSALTFFIFSTSGFFLQ